jgi:drug/metabolite transporter (DMT)-like permease
MTALAGVPARQGSLRVYGGLATGVLAVSWAAIFIRLAQAPALSIATWRLIFASLPALTFALVTKRAELARLTGRAWLLLAGSGVALGLHFATWIASLERTSVASSVALVTTQPVWVAVLAWVALGERIGPRIAGGIAVSLLGSVLIAGSDFGVSSEALIGDALATAGAIFAAAYFVLGRRVRATLSLGAYVGVVYAVAALALLGISLASGAPLSGFPLRTWTLLAMLALVPQLIGHSLLNWSLRYLSAPFVSMAILAEPVFSAALAVPLLDERPGWVQLLGGGFVLLGVYVAGREEARRAVAAGAGSG